MTSSENQPVFKWRFQQPRNYSFWQDVLPFPLVTPPPLGQPQDTLEVRQQLALEATGKLSVPVTYGRALFDEELKFYPKQLVLDSKRLKSADFRINAVSAGVPLLSHRVVRIIERVEPGAHQFIPVQLVDNEGAECPLKNGPFYFFQCCLNVEPSVALDWEFMERPPRRIMTDKYGDLQPDYSLRIRSNFSTEHHIFTISRYRTKADPPDASIRRGRWNDLYCSLSFVREVIAEHPYVGKNCDFNDFEAMPGTSAGGEWVWN